MDILKKTLTVVLFGRLDVEMLRRTNYIVFILSDGVME